MIYVIWGSPNSDGLTATCKNQIIEGIKETNEEVKEINISRCHLEHCHQCFNGWGTCLDKGECLIHDDYQLIEENIRKASGVVFISPVYYHDLAECFKALFDRLRRNNTHEHFKLEGKECLLIATAGASGHGCSECLHALEDPIRHCRMHALDRIGINQYSKDYILPMLKEAGKKFSQTVNKKNA